LSRVLFISSEFPPGPGGIGTHAFHVVNELQKNQKNIIVCTVSDYVNQKEKDSFDKNCSFPIIRFQRYNNFIFNWYNRINVIRKIIVCEQITHIFVSGRSSIWLIPIMKFISNPKVFVILHGSEIGKGIKMKWITFCLKKADNLIAVSNFTRNLIPIQFRLNTVVIHNGVNPFEWISKNKNGRLNNYPILLSVGSISFRKGQHNVVSALPFIKKKFPNVHYHCVGEPKQKESLLTLIRELDVGEIVTIHGTLSKKSLQTIYNKAHVNMILSEKGYDGDVEGYGISVLEGNVFGIPAIGSNHSGLKESICHNVNGLLINQKNPIEILNALNTVFTHYKNFYHQSQEFAKSNTWTKRITKYEKFIID